MTPQQVLRYQLALLLASSGRQHVLAALAELLKLRPEELEALLADVEKAQPRSEKKPKGNSSRETIELVVAQHPEKADALQALNARFSNKTFLPELRDVRRFLESHSHPSKSLKSRVDALPKLLKVLADLDLTELKSLCEQPDSSEYSSLGIISDHILGRERG